eukprot:jgi/Tetstr1/434795/TSEL_023845.t1
MHNHLVRPLSVLISASDDRRPALQIIKAGGMLPLVQTVRKIKGLYVAPEALPGSDADLRAILAALPAENAGAVGPLVTSGELCGTMEVTNRQHTRAGSRSREGGRMDAARGQALQLVALKAMEALLCEAGRMVWTQEEPAAGAGGGVWRGECHGGQRTGEPPGLKVMLAECPTGGQPRINSPEKLFLLGAMGYDAFACSGD